MKGIRRSFAPLPSSAHVARAVALIRRTDPHAALDCWPRDMPREMACPTALYLGVAIRAGWPRAPATLIARLCRVPEPDALEFALLLDLAGASQWINRTLVVHAVLALEGRAVVPDMPTRGAVRARAMT